MGKEDRVDAFHSNTGVRLSAAEPYSRRFARRAQLRCAATPFKASMAELEFYGAEAGALLSRPQAGELESATRQRAGGETE
jgi:hypothetical protein